MYQRGGGSEQLNGCVVTEEKKKYMVAGSGNLVLRAVPARPVRWRSTKNKFVSFLSIAWFSDAIVLVFRGFALMFLVGLRSLLPDS